MRGADPICRGFGLWSRSRASAFTPTWSRAASQTRASPTSSCSPSSPFSSSSSPASTSSTWPRPARPPLLRQPVRHPGASRPGLARRLSGRAVSRLFSLVLQAYGRAQGLAGKGRRSLVLRSGFVVFQFTMSVLLIIGSLVIFRQLKYIKSQRLGFDKDHVVVVHNANNLFSHYDAYRERLKLHSDILGVSAVGSIPGLGTSNWGLGVQGVADDRPLNRSPADCLSNSPSWTTGSTASTRTTTGPGGSSRSSPFWRSSSPASASRADGPLSGALPLHDSAAAFPGTPLPR